MAAVSPAVILGIKSQREKEDDEVKVNCWEVEV